MAIVRADNQTSNNAEAYNQVLSPYLLKFGFAWEDVLQELVNMIKAFENGSLPQATSLNQIYWVWSWRITIRITMTVANVSTKFLIRLTICDIHNVQSYICPQVIFKRKHTLKSRNIFQISHMP
jgi:hypothetical protein